MHELAVTQSILNISLAHAHKAQAKRITSINLVIGQLASVLDESVQFYWDIISDGTIAKGAVLKFHRIPMEMSCQTCGQTFTPRDDTYVCPTCSSPQVRVSQGEELRVESIDVE